MTGFGEKKQKKNVKNNDRTIKEARGKSFTDEAFDAYQKGDILRAKLLLDEAIRIFPNSSIALGLLATIEKSLGHKEKAMMLFEKSVLIDRNHPEILHNYSGLLEEEDIEEALQMSDAAIMISPGNWAFLERNGYLKWKNNDLHGALEISMKALDINPNLIDAHMNIGAIQKDLGNLDLAFAFTLKSLELKPDNPGAILNLCNLYGEGNLPILKSLARRAVDVNRQMLNDSSYIEAISSLGKDFARNLVSTTSSINQ